MNQLNEDSDTTKVSQEKKTEEKTSMWGVFFWIGVFVLIIVFSGDESDTQSDKLVGTQSTNTETFDPSKYYAQSSKTTFYTNAISNVRSCASAGCGVVTQTPMNTPMQLEYGSISSMPEWVTVSWTDTSGGLKTGYMNKSVFSNTVTAPAYSNTYYNSNIHYDNDYKYEYRTGYSGNYDYNYDVEGYGDNGYTSGNIDTSGKYGEGYIYDEEGNEIYVETEWTDYGVMEATDEDGNTYELEVE